MSMSMQMPVPESESTDACATMGMPDATFSTMNFGNGWDGGQGDIVIPPL